MIVKNDANTNQLVIKGKPEEVAEMLLQFIYKVQDGASVPQPPAAPPPQPEPEAPPVFKRTELYIERRKRGWTQAQVGAEVGCSDGHVSNLELRTHPAKKLYRRVFADVFGRSEEELFDSEGYAMPERG